MAAKNFRKLFEPYTVKSMTLRNRIVMTPIGTNFAEHTGEVNERIIDYYKQRAKGGTGLITIEAASVYSPQGASGAYQLRIDHDNYIPGLYRLCESIHDCGSKVSILLNHAGSAANGKMTNIQPVSASDIPSRVGGDIPRALTTDEIYTIVNKFAEAAKRAVTAGFDAVEIQAGHGYLLNQFLSPTTNDRTDEFGGSKENRARFTTLVLKAVRETIGENIPIFLGISADELAEGGNTLDDTLEIVEYFKDMLTYLMFLLDLHVLFSTNMTQITFQMDGNLICQKPLKKKLVNLARQAVISVNQKLQIVFLKMRKPSSVIAIGRGLIDLERRAMKLKNLFIPNKDTSFSIEFIEGFKPDIVVNATGSVPLLPNIPGLKENLEAGNVSTIFDLVDHVDSYPEDLTGKKVVVIGGGNVGLDVVEFFVPRKADVIIVEQKAHFGENLDFITKTGSIEFMNKNKVTQYPNASLLEVKEHSFIVKHDYRDLELDFDYGFVCLGTESATPSLQELYNHFIYEGVEVLNIGDSAQTRRIIEGVKEGRDILVALERQDFI